MTPAVRLSVRMAFELKPITVIKKDRLLLIASLTIARSMYADDVVH